MATIYRRNRGLSPTQLDDTCDPELKDTGTRRWWGWGHHRRRSALGDTSPLSVRNPIINGVVGNSSRNSSSFDALAARRRRFVSHRVSQILWLAVLVYAFLGLPVLGRVLNFVRYAHRFSVASVLKGLVAGLCQDVAVYFQAATLICAIKLVLDGDSALHTFGGSHSNGHNNGAASAGASPWLSDSTTSSSTMARAQRLPVYMPVLTSEYELNGTDDSSSTSTSDALGRHTTLLSHASHAAGPTTSYLSSLAPRGSWIYSMVRRGMKVIVTVTLICIVVLAATVPSVVDFCLQVTLHPRLNRAFVEVFVNYAAQFTASLNDDEVLTRTVVWSWSVYAALALILIYGFAAGKLPLLPRALLAPRWLRMGATSSACGGHGLLPYTSSSAKKRKDSMLSSTAASAANASTVIGAGSSTSQSQDSVLWRWLRLPSLKQPALPPPLRTGSANSAGRRRGALGSSLYQQQHANQQPTTVLAMLCGCVGAASSGSSSGVAANSYTANSAASKPSGVVVMFRCVATTAALTLFALTTSLLVDGKSSHSNGIDMKLMSNALFALETEGFFVKVPSVGRETINCTAASDALLATLGASEVYETAGLGNDDRCALLWRKTIGYTGESFFELTLPNVTTTTESTVLTDSVTVGDAPSAAPPSLSPPSPHAVPHSTDNVTNTESVGEPSSSSTPSSSPLTKTVMPNIIVINMESWRALDTGVLGGAARKTASNQSATPEFDALAATGILYRKHYTQCVQTTRTLLTQLFGMLPSCTETTALKRFATTLNVRGLPQFLKARGYSTLFWSAVNLSWEYWDKFLVANGFDKLVDDKKVRKMLHDVRAYKNQDDDHFSWGMHDDLSFEMLLYAIEASHNATALARMKAMNATVDSGGTATGNNTVDNDVAMDLLTDTTANLTATVSPPASTTKKKSLLRDHATTKDARAGHHHSVGGTATTSTTSPKSHPHHRLPGWEGLVEPFFIDMYTITSHNPWALPQAYDVPDLSALYTPYTKKYIDAMYFSDDMLGRFIRDMRAKGLMRNTVVVIQGDHGYGRMEHNNPSIADSGIYDEGAHVPFLLLADDFLAARDRGTVVDQLTMQSDLMATIADIVGVSPDAPLYQHGYGHSMKRRRPSPSTTSSVDADDADAAALRERRVVMCNPFNGMTKGVVTEKRKYAFFPDDAFKVFEPATDPGEKRPVRAGFDVDAMDRDVKTMFDYVTEHVDLNQFLFSANKFSTPLPPSQATVTAKQTVTHRPQQSHVQRMPIDVASSEQQQQDDDASRDATEDTALAAAAEDTAPALATPVAAPVDVPAAR